MAISTDKTPVLVDAVFGRERAERRSHRAALAWTLALALHAALFFLARLSGPSLETWSARIAAMVHRDLNANAPTAIETLNPPPPPPAAPKPEPESPPPPKAASPAIPRSPAAPAQAAKIIAADSPVDLTGDTFVTGTASAYAGGATTSSGTSSAAVSSSALATQAPASTKSSAPAQPVSLTSERWQCPWPAAALAQDLYEQSVVVRAWVRADGSVERVSVVSDPGYGFGAAAIACALHTRFNPARNARGEALRALSPPIRVRFTR
ncbi:MAG TPA: TonB family protein [Polyangiales bacterium]|nr:TonB family protein [Polyangiales bacterium]